MKLSPTAESIASKDLNNLYLTSLYFADLEKYRAFCSMYALMRVVDDRIDELSQRGALSLAERAHEHDAVRAWQAALFSLTSGPRATPAGLDRCGRSDARELLDGAAESMRLFPVPPRLWENFFTAMHRDIDQVAFSTWEDFLAYTEGASVAPTSIYLNLIAAGRSTGESYSLPRDFDLVECGRHLGRFAYIAHILRDLAKDVGAGERGLLYLAGEDLERHGLSLEALQEDFRREEARPALRTLVAELIERARSIRERGRIYLAPLEGRLTSDCAFILELIVRIYDAVLDKLESADCDPMAESHRLTLAEKQAIALEVARQRPEKVPEKVPLIRRSAVNR